MGGLGSRAGGGCLTAKTESTGFKWMCGEWARGCRSRCWAEGLVVRELAVELTDCEQEQVHHTVCLVPQGLQHLDGMFCLPTPFP